MIQIAKLFHRKLIAQAVTNKKQQLAAIKKQQTLISPTLHNRSDIEAINERLETIY